MEQQPKVAVEAPRAWDRPIVSVPVLAFMSLVGGQLPSFSLQANLYALGTGGALIWLGLSNRIPRRPPPRRLAAGSAWWVLPAAVFGIFELSTFALGSSDDFPTFSKLADPLLEDGMVRTAAYFAWLAAFWGMVRR